MSMFRAISAWGLFFAVAGSITAVAEPNTSVTYHRDVTRVMQKHCIRCHREGGVAPFTLETREDVEANAPMIQEVIRRGTMPPWFAAPEKDGSESPWANERLLSDEEKSTLKTWAKSGFPKGDVKDAPAPLNLQTGWQIETDSIYKARPVSVKATGVMDYVYITIDTNEEEDRWIDAIEIRPGAPQTVHHVLAFVIPSNGDTSRVNGIDYWGMYAPGSGPQIYQAGYARRLPKGSKLLLSMHYTPTGVATVDQTEIGVRFAKEEPRFEIMTASVKNTDFEIPAGAGNHEVTASVRLPRDIRVMAYLPHSHLRGKAARYELVSKDGKTETLLDIPRYDFNWQLRYEYIKPRKFQAGTRLKYTAWYDNSEDNPANPDPNNPVYWGEQTYEEMHIGYVEFIVPRKRR